MHILFDNGMPRQSDRRGRFQTCPTLVNIMMTSDIKPYPAYKPSDVEWLGDVPAHWEVLPNRAIFVEVNEQNCPEEQMLSVTIVD